MRFLFSQSKTQKASRGFTLIELLVVVAIFSVLTTVILYKNSDFNNSFLLTDVAYDVALTVRQAQVYGLNVKSTGKGTATDNFNAGYGVYFDRNNLGSMIFFADIFNTTTNPPKGNYAYDSPSESISNLSLQGGYSIRSFCATPLLVGPEVCSSGSGSLDKLAIVFVRPNPDAVITDNAVSGQIQYKKATITIESPDKTKIKKVIITNAGQISITN